MWSRICGHRHCNFTLCPLLAVGGNGCVFFAGCVWQVWKILVYLPRRWTFSAKRILPMSICVTWRKPKCMLSFEFCQEFLPHEKLWKWVSLIGCFNLCYLRNGLKKRYTVQGVLTGPFTWRRGSGMMGQSIVSLNWAVVHCPVVDGWWVRWWRNMGKQWKSVEKLGIVNTEKRGTDYRTYLYCLL